MYLRLAGGGTFLFSELPILRGYTGSGGTRDIGAGTLRLRRVPPRPCGGEGAEPRRNS